METNASIPSSSIFPGKYLDYVQIIQYKGNHLPHWEADSVIYHVSFRLADSIPESLIRRWIYERNSILEIANRENRQLTEEEVKRLQYLYSDNIEKYLDAGYGSCLLKEDAVAQIVKGSLEYYNGQKYLLHAWSIMPNHVHTIFEMLGNTPQREVLKAWKSFTAHAINKALNRKGQLWQVDSYNHIIRTEAEYYNQMRYVWNNPRFLPLAMQKWRWSCLVQAKDDNETPQQG